MSRAWGPRLLLLALALAIAPAGQAFGDETPPPSPPVDVPPLESPPVDIPPSTLPEGDFSGSAPSASNSPPPQVTPPDMRPIWETATPEQLAYLSGLGRGVLGYSVVIYTGPNGELIIQDATGGAVLGMEPNPELASLTVSREGVVLGAAPQASTGVPAGNDSRLAVPATPRVSFSLTNRSPQAAYVFIRWIAGDAVVSESRLLQSGENWTGDLDASGAIIADGALIVETQSTGRFEDNAFSFAAVASPSAK